MWKVLNELELLKVGKPMPKILGLRSNPIHNVKQMTINAFYFQNHEFLDVLNGNTCQPKNTLLFQNPLNSIHYFSWASETSSQAKYGGHGTTNRNFLRGLELKTRPLCLLFRHFGLKIQKQLIQRGYMLVLHFVGMGIKWVSVVWGPGIWQETLPAPVPTVSKTLRLRLVRNFRLQQSSDSITEAQ